MPDDMNLQGLGGVGGIEPSRGKSTRPTEGTDASFKDLLFQKISLSMTM